MATIKDVALKANVGISTVSRVINNSGSVNPETRKLVEKAIKELNYIPNELARSLFNKSSNIIGFVLPNISSIYLLHMIEALEKIVNENNYKLMIFNTLIDPLLESNCARFITQYNLDGIILMGFTWNPKIFTSLPTPLCTIDHIIDEDTFSVSSNNFEGGRLAALKLIETGCKKLIHFRGPSELVIVSQRSEGFHSVLDKTNAKLTEYDFDMINPDFDQLYEIIENNSDVDGIFCDSDTIAFYVLRILKVLDLDVPNQVSVIGFDNIKLSKVFTPALTTISQPIHKIAKAAFQNILDQINKKEIETKKLVLPIELIERETTK